MQNFQKANIDGYTLIQLREHDLEIHLRIDSLGLRKNIIKNICILKALWVRLTGDSAHGLNVSEHPSILGESWDGDQSSMNLRSTLIDDKHLVGQLDKSKSHILGIGSRKK